MSVTVATPQQTDLHVAVVEHGTTSIIELDGSWDDAAVLAHSGTLARVLGRRGVGCLVLDLTRLRSIDTTGIDALLRLVRRAQSHHVHLVIMPAPPTVQNAITRHPAGSCLPFVASRSAGDRTPPRGSRAQPESPDGALLDLFSSARRPPPAGQCR